MTVMSDHELDLPVAELERPPRAAAHVLIDADLRLLSDNIDIRNWFGLEARSLQGCSLTEVFPELRGYEDNIQHLIYNPADCFIRSQLHRRARDKREEYFDLQFSSAPGVDQRLQLIVIDVTQKTLVSHRLQEIRSIPPLKTTPEEIKQNLDALEHWNHALVLLNRAGQVLTATLDTQKVLEQLLIVTIELIGAEGSSVWLKDEIDSEYLVCQAAYHQGSRSRTVEQRLHIGQGLAGWVAETGKSAAVIRAEDDPRFSPEIDGPNDFASVSLLVVPLRLREEILGVLEVANKLTGDFDTDDLAIAETLAASASIAIENARLVEALQKQTDDLRARNEELDAFAHTVAHDLQNPLAQIIGFAELLDGNRGGLNESDRDMALRVISGNAQKMSSIIRELLMLASVRKTEVELQPLDMQQIVEAALDRLTHVIKALNADVVLPGEWPPAVGYPPWIEEIWENYLSNALKYGGRPPRLELGGSARTDGMVRFWVRDNGEGLSRDEQAKLFTPFTKMGIDGYGLGLSIVRRIADKLGGQVEVESETGAGSVFSFTLPGIESSG